MDGTFLDERITATKLAIVEYEAALAALATGVQSYTLDTGQTRQVVTRHNITSMTAALDTLYDRLSTLDTRKDGRGVKNMRPGW